MRVAESGHAETGRPVAPIAQSPARGGSMRSQASPVLRTAFSGGTAALLILAGDLTTQPVAGATKPDHPLQITIAGVEHAVILHGDDRRTLDHAPQLLGLIAAAAATPTFDANKLKH